MSRKSRKIEQKNKFYIYTNGKETELNYLKLLKSKRSIYDVEIKFENGDPFKLVKYAYSNSNTTNQIWCVFDVDDFLLDGRLTQALDFAERNDIHIALSNKAFEVWLLSHYYRVTSPMNNNQLIEKMNLLLKEITKKDLFYDKSDKELLSKYFIPNINTAINNSKITYQKFIKEGCKISDMNPCTTMFYLVEALKLQSI